MKTNTALTKGIFIEILEDTKIDVLNTKVANSIEEVRTYSSVDEVEVTSVSDVLSWVEAKSDWTFVSTLVVTIKLSRAISMLDVVTSFLGE